MGRKKKNYNFKNNIINLFVALVIILLILLGNYFDLFNKLDNLIAKTEFYQNLNTNELKPQTVKKDEEIYATITEKISIAENKLNILFFDVGQADCELLICNGKTMLIDAGNSKDGEKIVNGLKALGINKLDYVIGTHVHEDHIGGMSYIIDEFDVDNFYLPYDTKTTTTYYKKLLNSISNKNLSITEAKIGDKFELGNASCEIMFVDNNEPENINESSIVVEVSYGNLKYLFMGDAEKDNENSREWNDIDVLKVGHHGSNTSSSEEFLKQVLPEIAIIPVAKDNSYNLPKEKIIERLKNLGTVVYRTDEDGTIQIISDGEKNEVFKIPINFDGNR